MFYILNSLVVFSSFWWTRVVCRLQLYLWNGSKENLGEKPSHQKRHPVLGSRNHGLLCPDVLGLDHKITFGAFGEVSILGTGGCNVVLPLLQV